MNFKRKLWWAQHRTDVYKYSTIILLILVVAISIIYFTHSKFSSSNEITMYETTVEPFIKNDYFIASYIDGEWSNEIPGKNDGYAVDKVVCDNDAVGTWDNDTWSINISNATKKIKCGVYFKKVTKLIEKITNLSSVDTTNFAIDDPGNNIRYIGADPNNYVYFNCSDYSNQSDSTCEKWRIIGVFKNITKADGTKENLVKIIRNDRLNNINIRWDYKQTGVGTSITNYGSNDWTDSQLMMMLNPKDYLKSGYTIENNVVKDSYGQEIYQNMGSYYNGTSGCQPASITSGSSFSCTSIDFASTGLKNDLTRNAIEGIVWNLGGTATYNSTSTGLASHWYDYERGTNVYSGHATTWTGKIGLMYPSDYGYATSGGSTTNRTSCLSTMLYYNGWNNVNDCYGNDYLFKAEYSQWTLTPISSAANGIFIVTLGNINRTNALNNNYSVHPSAYLKSNVLISNGEGTSASPYQLKLS